MAETFFSEAVEVQEMAERLMRDEEVRKLSELAGLGREAQTNARASDPVPGGPAPERHRLAAQLRFLLEAYTKERV